MPRFDIYPPGIIKDNISHFFQEQPFIMMGYNITMRVIIKTLVSMGDSTNPH